MHGLEYLGHFILFVSRIEQKSANFSSISTTKQKSLACKMIVFACKARDDHQILQVLNCLFLHVSDNEALHFWRSLNCAISTADKSLNKWKEHVFCVC